MGYIDTYNEWCTNLIDTELMRELDSIKNDSPAIEDRFYRELSFGTAGLRGIIGVGTNRMNIPVVRRATLGLSNYINKIPNAAKQGVCIAYDSRNMSPEFARCATDALTSQGIHVYLFSSLRSVPQLSFTLRRLNCIAGIMITASHNPKEYNGYKVYWKDGGQLAPSQADAVTECIEAQPYFGIDIVPNDALVTMLSQEDDEPYYEATTGLLTYKELLLKKGADMPIVYTPLHGAGYTPVTTILSRIGITNVSVVSEQAIPDGSFPTVSYPNPEDPDAFKLAIRLAKSKKAEVILATDPDSDRLGVAVLTNDGEYKLLTGNQIGAILIYHLINAKKATETLPPNALVVKSIVSTSLADAICRKYGVGIISVPTGFRFISEVIERCNTTGEHEFLFGFEESYGFLAGGFSHDKDAVLAAMLISEACVYYRQYGKTLYDVLCDIYNEFGYYSESVKSYTWEGKAGIERIENVMRRLCNNPPTRLANIKVIRAEDYSSGIAVTLGDKSTTESLTFPRMNMLRLILSDDAWVCVRPSGTEPKLKLYVGAKADSMDASIKLGKSILRNMDVIVSQES